MSRSVRAETRSRAKDDIKRVMQAVDKVRHWYDSILIQFSVTKNRKRNGDFVHSMSNPILTHLIFVHTRKKNREKKWVTIGDTTMKIFKWVPISSSEQKKHLKTAVTLLAAAAAAENKENTKASPPLEVNGNSVAATGNSGQTPAFGLTGDDSNTCFSTVSDSQPGADFVSGAPFSEDSNSQSSDAATSAKRLLTK